MPFLQSITSLFTGTPSNNTASSSRQSRRTVMNSTFDAFSLPTPTARYEGRLGAGMGDAADSVTSSPGPSRRGSYSYPPPNDSYRPSTNFYPPLSHTFHRLRNSLVDSFPELVETLNPPADPLLITSFERELRCPLPNPVRESFLVADGQDIDSGCLGLFFGLHLLPIEDVIREWTFWRQAEHDPESGRNPAVLATMASVPPDWIKQLYACRGWIPLLSDRTGNYIGVDLDPGPGGSWGQVIVFGRDFDRKCVLWGGDGEGGWGKWLASFVDELESGDGWEADKSNSSDEDEEAGYGSYNGGAQYGESGKGLRLAGEYRGWNVLEAWWDRSVRRWEELNLGLDVDEIERGLFEAKRLAGLNEKNQDEAGGIDVGMRAGESSTQVEIPVIGSHQIPQAPSTPVPGDSDILLPPASPEHPAIQNSRYKASSKAPVRVIIPVTQTLDHPLKAGPSDRDLGTGYLSPPNRRRSRVPPPAPSPLDLPTRADVQAMSAIARAEESGLRGGWVMNIDPGIGARRWHMNNGDSEMVDVDLEGGRREKFGSPRVSIEEMERRREEEKLALASVEHRPSPPLISTRTPSPLSREASLDMPDLTPKPLASRMGENSSNVPPSVVVVTNMLRRPPPVANHSDVTVRGRQGIAEEERDKEVMRHRAPLSRTEREASVISTGSQDGLLGGSIPSRVGTPPLPTTTTTSRIKAVNSPTKRRSLATNEPSSTDSTHSTYMNNPTIRLVTSPKSGLKGLEGDMEEVKLDTVATTPIGEDQAQGVLA